MEWQLIKLRKETQSTVHTGHADEFSMRMNVKLDSVTNKYLRKFVVFQRAKEFTRWQMDKLYI